MEFYLKQKVEFIRNVYVDCNSEDELKELVNTTDLDWKIDWEEDFIEGNIEVFDEYEDEDTKLFELNLEDLKCNCGLGIDSKNITYNYVNFEEEFDF